MEVYLHAFITSALDGERGSGDQSRSGGCGEEKIMSLLSGIEPGFFGRAVRLALYRLNCHAETKECGQALHKDAVQRHVCVPLGPSWGSYLKTPIRCQSSYSELIPRLRALLVLHCTM